MTAPQERPATEHRRIAVGVDGSSHSRAALKWACDEAERQGCLLHVLFAELGGPHNLPSWYEEGQSVISPGQAVLDDAFGLAVTRQPSVIVEAEFVVSPPALALTVASRTADLLVVGARGKGGFDELLLGSVSDQCIQYSHCPVAVVSEDPDDRRAREVDARIVVGIDGSFGSSQALRWALQEASVRSASVEALHAWQYPPIGSFVLGPPQGFEAAGREIVDGALEFQGAMGSRRALLGARRPGRSCPIPAGRSRWRRAPRSRGQRPRGVQARSVGFGGPSVRPTPARCRRRDPAIDGSGSLGAVNDRNRPIGGRAGPRSRPIGE